MFLCSAPGERANCLFFLTKNALGMIKFFVAAGHGYHNSKYFFLVKNSVGIIIIKNIIPLKSFGQLTVIPKLAAGDGLVSIDHGAG